MKFWTVDAFTAEAFSGNPAAVFILDHFLSDDLLQKIASEMNLSETAFAVKLEEGHYHLRWFTPKTEVELCGHATLSTAHILWEKELVSRDTKRLKFKTLSGNVFCEQEKNGTITMNFPVYEAEPIAVPIGLANALATMPVSVWKAYDDIIVELRTEDEVQNLKPSVGRLSQIDTAGIIITAEASKKSDYDYVLRYFAPRQGISEDPVTGSAHAKLAPYWAERLQKNSLKARQVSKRGGDLTLSLEDDRVDITGAAKTMIEGNLLI